MFYMHPTRSCQISIQFGEILPYIDTVSIGNRYIYAFSHPFPVLFHPFPVLSHPFPVFSRPFPHRFPPKNPYRSQPMHHGWEMYCEILRPTCVMSSKITTLQQAAI